MNVHIRTTALLTGMLPGCFPAGIHASQIPLYVLLAGTTGRQTESKPDSTASADPAARFRQGTQAMQQGQLQVAEDDFKAVIAIDPQSSAAHVNLGVTYMREKRWDEALTELEKAHAMSPNQAGISLNIGLAYYRRNHFAAAIEPLTAALQQAPTSDQARYLLGLCFFFTDKYIDASATLQPLWAAQSTNLNYLYVLTIAANKASDSALQKQAFDRMLAIGQDKPEFHLYAGKAYLAEDDAQKALAEFEMAAAGQPSLPLVHYFLGRTYLQQHDYVKAETQLMADIAIEPDFAYNYEDLGILYSQQGQPTKAEQYFRLAIEHDTTLANSYFNLGKLLRQSGRYQDALDVLDHAVTLAPQSASVHYLRAQVLARLGKSGAAHQEFGTAATLLKSFNDQIQQDPLGSHSADAQNAAQQ